MNKRQRKKYFKKRCRTITSGVIVNMTAWFESIAKLTAVPNLLTGGIVQPDPAVNETGGEIITIPTNNDLIPEIISRQIKDQFEIDNHNINIIIG